MMHFGNGDKPNTLCRCGRVWERETFSVKLG